MKIPTVVKIGGYDIRIVNEDAGLGDGDANFDITTLTIRIGITNIEGKIMADDYRNQLFVHETVHAIDEIYFNDQLKEDIVSVLAHALYQVIKENQDIFKSDKSEGG